MSWSLILWITTSSVCCFNEATLKHANEDQTIKTSHVFLDGAGSQFKNRYTLSGILAPTELHQELQYVDCSFFATAHGKGPIDGVGRRKVKRAVWRRILQCRAIVNLAKESCPNVNILFITKDDAAEVQAN